MDKDYWTEYYKLNVAPIEPSNFAKDTLPIILNHNTSREDITLLELGCGNGRDCVFFAQNGISVIAIDQSDEIQNLKSSHYKCGNLNFIQDNFITFRDYLQSQFNCIYSRFTLHSIREDEENVMIKNAYNALFENGIFLIEVRSVKDNIFGKGIPANGERNAYIYENHYRRFIELEEMIQKLQVTGFNILYSEEKSGFAPYKEENPIVIRIIAEKIIS